MEGDATGDSGVVGVDGHAIVHGGVHKPERDGLVADQRLQGGGRWAQTQGSAPDSRREAV